MHTMQLSAQFVNLEVKFKFSGPPLGDYTKYDMSCHLLYGITQRYNCLQYISLFTNKRSNWLFGHYRTLTSLLEKRNTLIVKRYRNE